jgi:hypothetical protein
MAVNTLGLLNVMKAIHAINQEKLPHSVEPEGDSQVFGVQKVQFPVIVDATRIQSLRAPKDMRHMLS